jgi:ribulose 1,5-bisphosphate synthetase/thiazole synthase
MATRDIYYNVTPSVTLTKTSGPPGTSVAVNGAGNAGLLAARILALSDAKLADNEKLLRFNALVTNADEIFKPICDFAESIKDDLETKEAIKLFVEDEMSTVKWLKYACAALNAPAQQPVAKPAMGAQASA